MTTFLRQSASVRFPQRCDEITNEARDRSFRFVSFPTRDPGDSFLDEYDEYDDEVGIDPLVPLATSAGDVRGVLYGEVVLSDPAIPSNVLFVTYVFSKINATYMLGWLHSVSHVRLCSFDYLYSM